MAWDCGDRAAAAEVGSQKVSVSHYTTSLFQASRLVGDSAIERPLDKSGTILEHMFDLFIARHH